MKNALVVAMLLASATALHAQTPPAEGGKPRPQRERMMDCSKASDPAKCEERRTKMREAHRQAEAACKDRQGPERRACMGEQMCAQAPDPAKCNERNARRAEKHKEQGADRHKERSEARHKAREACKDKQGDEMKQCMREQRPPREAPKH